LEHGNTEHPSPTYPREVKVKKITTSDAKEWETADIFITKDGKRYKVKPDMSIVRLPRLNHGQNKETDTV